MPAARSILLAASSAACTLVLAAPAAASTVSTSSCVRTAPGLTSQQPISGTGFTPGGRVVVTAKSSARATPRFVTAVTADAAGNFATMARPPSFNPFRRTLQTFELTATDQTNPANAPSRKFKQVRVGYSTKPSSGRPSRRARHRVRGFDKGRNIYLHFRYRGRTRRTVKVGRARTSCGVASRRMSLLPARSRVGKWTVYADQRRRFSTKTKPQLKRSFRITRRFF